MGIAAITRPSVTNLPARTSSETPSGPINGLTDDDLQSRVSDDPYGQLADLDFANGGTGGGYETDMPRPRGGDEDLLF